MKRRPAMSMRADGTPREAIREIGGAVRALAFSPDGTRMYLSDSHPDVQRIWQFDYDIDTGTRPLDHLIQHRIDPICIISC